ncbi:MAG: holo-ACP synthase [Acidimicrobiia bacterium]|nr:holo-ACP synthase [Acidimicrobiia bacterium]
MIVGIGVDAVEVDRFAASLTRTPSLAARLFTPGERGYGDEAQGALRVQRLAARFAAKEAVLKAMGVGLGACGFHDIEVVRDNETSVPSIALHGAALELAAERGVITWHVSLTHTDATASAFVVAER